MIRDLKGVIERERAGMGVFLTLTEPTKPMVTEAASAGQHEEPGFAPVPRIADRDHRGCHGACANGPSNCPPDGMTPSSAPRGRRIPGGRGRWNCSEGRSGAGLKPDLPGARLWPPPPHGVFT